MPKQSKGGIKLDVRESTPDWDAFLADKAPQGVPNVLVVLYEAADDAYIDVEQHLAAAIARD